MKNITCREMRAGLFVFLACCLEMSSARIYVNMFLGSYESGNLCTDVSFFGPTDAHAHRFRIDGKDLRVYVKNDTVASFDSSNCQQRVQWSSRTGLSSSRICAYLPNTTDFAGASINGTVQIFFDAFSMGRNDYTGRLRKVIISPAPNYDALGGIPYCEFLNGTCDGKCLRMCRDLGRNNRDPYVQCNGRYTRVSSVKVTGTTAVLQLNVNRVIRVAPRQLLCIEIFSISPTGARASAFFFHEIAYMEKAGLRLEYSCGNISTTTTGSLGGCISRTKSTPLGRATLCWTGSCREVNPPYALVGSADLLLSRQDDSLNMRVVMDETRLDFEPTRRQIYDVNTVVSKEERCNSCGSCCQEYCVDIIADIPYHRCVNCSMTTEAAGFSAATTTTVAPANSTEGVETASFLYTEAIILTIECICIFVLFSPVFLIVLLNKKFVRK